MKARRRFPKSYTLNIRSARKRSAQLHDIRKGMAPNSTYTDILAKLEYLNQQG